MSGSIDRILVELRPRLQSASFFILFHRKFSDIESTKIDLAPDRITVTSKGADGERYEIRLDDFFKLHTQTLSSLMIKNNYICFRINTNENKFSSEVLEIQECNLYSAQKLDCLLEPAVRYKLLCSNCDNSLCDDFVTFKRVLELPSEQMDSGEWFCHRHDHHDGTENGTDSASSSSSSSSTPSPAHNGLEPYQHDLFYGPFYALVHRTLLQRVHLRCERFFYCKRCLQFLGTMKQKRNSAKLWYDYIRFQPDNGTRVPIGLFRTDHPLDNFRYLVRKTIQDFNFISYLGLPPIFKIIFELRRPGLEGDVFYLLMQIMDANLSVFRVNRKHMDEHAGSCSDEVDDRPEDTDNRDGDEDDDVFVSERTLPPRLNVIHLERHRTMKLMYRYEKYDQQPLVNFWLEDSNVVTVEISEPLFMAAVRYLDANSGYVPECYRHNIGFTLSYLDIS